MALERRTTDIQERFGPVRLRFEDVRQIHAHLSYSEERRPVIRAGQFDADSPEDLLDIADATLPSLSMAVPLGLSVTMRLGVLMVCNRPSAEELRAAELVRQVLRERRVHTVLGAPANSCLRMCLTAVIWGALCLVGLGATDDSWRTGWPYLWLTLAGVGTSVVSRLVLRSSPHPVVLHPDEIPANLLRRYAVEIGLVLTAVGIVVTTVVGLQAD